MRHTPRHPDNPCRTELPTEEQVPAKFWELLRRNESFRKAVGRLRDFDRSIQTDDPKGQIMATAHAYLDHVKGKHCFAGHALEWLVPDPLFTVRKVVPASGQDTADKASVSLETITEGIGISPDLKDRSCWKWERIKPGEPRLSGTPFRRGPMIEWQTSATPLYHRRENPIAAWKQFIEQHGAFGLDHSWTQAPSGFKSVFCWLWRRLDSRAKHSVTGLRFDAAFEHETNLFRNWSPTTAFVRGSVQEEDVARALMFDDLARHYRVFAVPKAVRSRAEAHRLGKWLAAELSRLPDGGELPEREPMLLGTPIEWDVFLFAGKCYGDPLLEAYRQVKPELPASTRLKKWRKEEQNYINHFRAISRHVEAVFPAQILDWEPRKADS